MKRYYGEFNENGYEIFLVGNMEGAIYQAGNCKYDSYQWLPVGGKGVIDIITIEDYCNSTGREIAKENGGVWTGCSRIENFDLGE